MIYLSVRNLQRYQHADILKKSDGKPPWVKMLEAFWEDYDLNAKQKPATRVFALRILNLASRAENLVPYDEAWLANRSSLTRPQVKEAVRELLAIRYLESSDSGENISQLISESVAPKERREEKKRLKTGEGVGTEARSNGETPDKEIEVDRLVSALKGCDKNTKQTLWKFAKHLPVGSIAKVRESSKGKPPSYAYRALESELSDRRSR